MRTRVLCLALLAILMGAASWWIVGREAAARGAAAADAPAAASASGSQAAAPTAPVETAGAEAAAGRRDDAATAQTVWIEVVDAGGAAVPANFAFAEFPGRDAPFLDLSPQREVMSRREWEAVGVRKEHAADGRLRIDSEVASGIAVHVRGPGMASCFLRVPPQLGTSARQVVLDDRRCHLHVHVWDSELRVGAASVAVECVDEKEAIVASGRTDPSGSVLFDLEPAGYVVRVAGADVADADGRKVVGLARQRGVTQTVVLAVPERRFDLKLHVSVRSEERAAPLSLGFLRVDGGREALVPAIRDMRPGDLETTVRLAAGAWRAIVLPQGGGQITGEAVVEAGPDGAGEARIGIEAGSKRRLTLRGLAESEYPVRVRYLDADDLDETLSTQAFAGPLTWHRAEAEVGLWPQGARLLVHHRNRSWLGELPREASQDAPEVHLVAATTLRISVADAKERPVATILHARGGTPRAMHRRLLDQGLGPTPVWFVFDVVPNGPVDVAISDTGGAEIARRHAEATGGCLDLRL